MSYPALAVPLHNSAFLLSFPCRVHLVRIGVLAGLEP
jgi:hypothetical protein